MAPERSNAAAIALIENPPPPHLALAFRANDLSISRELRRAKGEMRQPSPWLKNIIWYGELGLALASLVIDFQFCSRETRKLQHKPKRLATLFPLA